MSLRQVVNEWVSLREKELLTSYVQKRLRASGNYGDSINSEVNVSGTSINVKIQAARHAEFMELGRPPNEDQSEEGLRSFVGYAGSTFLRQWVQDKGLSISPYAVAYKIARMGIQVPNRFNPGGVISDVLNDESIQQLIDEVGEVTINNISSDILNELRNGNN